MLMAAPADERRVSRFDGGGGGGGGGDDCNGLSSSLPCTKPDEAPSMARINPIHGNDFILCGFLSLEPSVILFKISIDWMNDIR